MGPFRINHPQFGATDVGTESKDKEFRFYLDRLLKMIPAEVVSLYLGGMACIPKDQAVGLLGWAVFCLGLVIVFGLRVYGTADPAAGKGPQWIPVVISMGAFVIWVYALGGPFVAFDFYIPWLGPLLVMAYTVLVPLVYKGPKT